jgi:hypothetical protein
MKDYHFSVDMTNQTINLVKAPAVDDAGQTWKPGDFELKLAFR